MEKNEIAEKIRKVIVSVVGHENFEMKDALTADAVSGWDSLSHMIIITDLEKEFDIKFKLKELNKMKDVGVLIEMIQTKLSN